AVYLLCPAGDSLSCEMRFDRRWPGTYHAPAMANLLLEYAAPDYFARRNQVVEIIEKLLIFERLSGIVREDFEALAADRIPADWQQSPVAVSLQFGWADARERLPELHGAASATMPAVCQRCLEPCTISLSANFRVLLIDSKNARSVDDALDVWGIDENRLRPLDVVEEMLVMELPMAAMHESMDDCIRLPDTVSKERSSDTVRPFADLKARIEQSR
ncbi:MAG: DUF177 domain-containing protein, partial [Halioglobus sp.]|nr:DUF177 domain-containing protein [Halioglobus sp.]